MTLHLVRRGEPLVPVAEGDIVVYLDGRDGPVAYDRLVELIAAARRVLTW